MTHNEEGLPSVPSHNATPDVYLAKYEVLVAILSQRENERDHHQTALAILDALENLND